MFVHRAKLVIALSGASGFGGYVIATLGVNHRVSNLESLAHTNSDRIARLEENDRVKTYMLCVLVKKADPIATPPECGPVASTPPFRSTIR